MTLIAFETTRKFRARYPNGPITQEYTALGESDYELAMAAALTQIPLWVSGLPRQEIVLERAGDRDNEAWKANAVWELKPTNNDEPEDPPTEPAFRRWNFTTQGATAHIVVPYIRRGIYVPQGEATPTLSGLIGDDGDQVAGVDIDFPCFEWSETWYCPAAMMTQSYLNGVAYCKGINVATFRGFAGDEVFFRGLQGNVEVGKMAELDFCFAAFPNVTNLVVGGITIPEKHGWDYVWGRTEKTSGPNNTGPMFRTTALVVDIVHRQRDFSVLGIG